MPDKMNLDSGCLIVKHEAMTMSLVGEEAKKKKAHANLGYKATKHIERTFLKFNFSAWKHYSSQGI